MEQQRKQEDREERGFAGLRKGVQYEKESRCWTELIRWIQTIGLAAEPFQASAQQYLREAQETAMKTALLRKQREVFAACMERVCEKIAQADGVMPENPASGI